MSNTQNTEGENGNAKGWDKVETFINTRLRLYDVIGSPTPYQRGLYDAYVNVLRIIPAPALQSQEQAPVTGEKIQFGDYVLVEMKRYGVPNEFYKHKVTGVIKSILWTDVPAITHVGNIIHNQIEDVVQCICCGILEETVVRYRLRDVQKVEPLPSLTEADAIKEAEREYPILEQNDPNNDMDEYEYQGHVIEQKACRAAHVRARMMGRCG